MTHGRTVSTRTPCTASQCYDRYIFVTGREVLHGVMESQWQSIPVMQVSSAHICCRRLAICGASAAARATASRPEVVCLSDYAVKIKGLSHQFGEKRVRTLICELDQCHLISCSSQDCAVQILRSANLEVERGSLHILAGANGCGKSTLLRILGGLLTKQAGEIKIDGSVGMVLQNPDHQIVMPTVAAEVAFGLGRSDTAATTRRGSWKLHHPEQSSSNCFDCLQD